MNFLRRFIDFLAKTGLWFRADPPKVIELAGREWGPSAGDLALSIRPVEGSDPARLSVILRNLADDAREISIPAWIHFLHAHVTAPGGGEAPLTPYGQSVLDRKVALSDLRVHLPANAPVEIPLPIGLLYQMTTPGAYRVRLSGEVPLAEGVILLESNDVAIVVGRSGRG